MDTFGLRETRRQNRSASTWLKTKSLMIAIQSFPALKAAEHRLQRTAAVPLLCGRGLPEIAQVFKQISPAPPLPLSQTVRRIL